MSVTSMEEVFLRLAQGEAALGDSAAIGAPPVGAAGAADDDFDDTASHRSLPASTYDALPASKSNVDVEMLPLPSTSGAAADAATQTSGASPRPASPALPPWMPAMQIPNLPVVMPSWLSYQARVAAEPRAGEAAARRRGARRVPRQRGRVVPPHDVADVDAVAQVLRRLETRARERTEVPSSILAVL